MIYLPTIASAGYYIPAALTPAFLFVGGIFLILATYAGYLAGKSAATRWEGNVPKISTLSALLVCGLTIAALFAYGVSMTTIQIIAASCVFVYASYQDIKTREADDWIHVLLLMIALVGHSITDLFWMGFSCAAIFGIMLFTASVSNGKSVGGADIKFAAATSVAFGLESALVGTFVGTLIAVIHNAIRKKMGKPDGFPLVPYLSIGYTLAFFIKAITAIAV